MKKSALLLLLTVVFALQGYTQKKANQVKVKDWGKQFVAFPADYWEDEKADSIIKQIGKVEYDNFIANYRKLPKEMQLFGGGNMKRPTELYPKLDKLKMYHIATYRHLSDGDMPIAILKVPYDENKNWDPEVKWDTAYFVISVKALIKE